jgi:hypothetical protein
MIFELFSLYLKRFNYGLPVEADILAPPANKVKTTVKPHNFCLNGYSRLTSKIDGRMKRFKQTSINLIICSI